MKKKFALVNIPTIENAYHSFSDFAAIPPSIGLSAIAAAVEKLGHVVIVYEGDAEGFSTDQMLDRIARDQPDYVGSTTMTATMDACYGFYSALKRNLPSATVILGGPHVSALPTLTLEQCPAIDIVVKGEGDETIVGVLEALENGGSLALIPGLAFRNGREIVDTGPAAVIKDLGRLPLPAHHLLRYDLYRSYGWNKWVSGFRKPLGVVFTSRGCHGKCNFCAAQCVFGSRVRYFPMEWIQEEIDLLVKRYGIRVLYFQDDNFTFHRRRVNQICEFLMERGYHKRLEIMASARVDSVHLETLIHMRKAGIRWICFGVESGNDQILSQMNKRITVEKVRAAFSLARKAGLFVAGNYMIGHLGETYQTAMDTINLACELDQDYASFAVAIPLPGTELYRHCLENNIELPDWNGFGSVNTPPIPLNDSLDVNQLMELRRIAARRFFGRPLYLMRMLRRFDSLAVVRDFYAMYRALRHEIRAKRY